MILDIKRKNFLELKNFTSTAIEEVVIAQNEELEISIKHPTNYSILKNKRANDFMDVEVLWHESQTTPLKLETIELGKRLSQTLSFEKLEELKDRFLNWSQSELISFSTTTDTFDFTVPKYSDIGFNGAQRKILLNIMMIGVNDNGRYHKLSEKAGMFNHLMTALASAYLFCSDPRADQIRNKLNELGINDLKTFKNFLYGEGGARGKIISDDIFAQT